MTAVVISSVAIAITGANYLLLLAVVRRLAVLQRRIALLGQGGSSAQERRVDPPQLILEPGQRLDLDLLRSQIPQHDGTDRMLVGFFSVDCPACRNQIAPFNRGMSGNYKLQKVAVIAADKDGHADSIAEELDEDIDVRLAGPRRTALHELFAVTGFPSFALIDKHGVVLASGWEVSDVVSARLG